MALMAFPASPAHAGVDTWDPPIALSDAGLNGFTPQVVSDGETITAAWSLVEGGIFRIQAASSLDGGLTWSAPATLSAAGHNAFDPQLVTDGDTITVVWFRSDGLNDRVEAATSSDGGLTWSAAATLSNAGVDATNVQVATDGETITAIWQSVSLDDDDFRVEASSSTDGGVVWSAPVALSDAGQNATNPQLIAGETTITAIWQASDGVSGGIQVSSSVDDGITWSAPVAVSGLDGADPQIVTVGATVTAIWYVFDGSNTRVQTSVSTNGGVEWSPPATISEAGVSAFDPRLVANGTVVVAAWTRFADDGWRTVSSYSTDGGLEWSTPVVVSAEDGNAFQPHIAFIDGAVAVGWYRFDGSNFRVQVSSSLDCGLNWDEPVTLSAGGVNSLEPRLASANGTLTVVWAGSDGSTSRVQASSLTSTAAGAGDPGDFSACASTDTVNPPAATDEPAAAELAETGTNTYLGLGLALALLLGGALLTAARRSSTRLAMAKEQHVAADA